MPATPLIAPPARADLLAGLPPLLSVVPQAGRPLFAYAGFGAVLLLLLVPPFTLLATPAVVALVVATGARRARRAVGSDPRGAVRARPPSPPAPAVPPLAAGSAHPQGEGAPCLITRRNPGACPRPTQRRSEVVRPRLFGIAYRVLGGAAEAEEVVQDTWIRWHRTNRRTVRDAKAFLATATTRLAINVADSARARHESPRGGWLPEPIDVAPDPTISVERDEEPELAIRTLLERLSAAERAVLVLRDAFDYPYREVADVLGLSEANARQVLVRARARLGGERRRDVSRGEHRLLLTAFSAASITGDLAQLEQLLAGEVAASGPLPAAA